MDSFTLPPWGTKPSPTAPHARAQASRVPTPAHPPPRSSRRPPRLDGVQCPVVRQREGGVRGGGGRLRRRPHARRDEARRPERRRRPAHDLDLHRRRRRLRDRHRGRPRHALLAERAGQPLLRRSSPRSRSSSRPTPRRPRTTSRTAFEISEQFGTPVLFRMTTRDLPRQDAGHARRARGGPAPGVRQGHVQPRGHPGPREEAATSRSRSDSRGSRSTRRRRP